MLPFIVTFIVLSLGGAINAGYLFYQHRKRKPLVCPMNHDCSVVTESKWSHVFGVRNEVLGFLFYCVLLAGIFMSVFMPELIRPMPFFLFLATSAGLLFSLFLIFLQKFVIKDYCFYCLISAIISLFLFLNSLALLAI